MLGINLHEYNAWTGACINDSVRPASLLSLLEFTPHFASQTGSDSDKIGHKYDGTGL